MSLRRLRDGRFLTVQGSNRTIGIFENGVSSSNPHCTGSHGRNSFGPDGQSVDIEPPGVFRYCLYLAIFVVVFFCCFLGFEAMSSFYERQPYDTIGQLIVRCILLAFGFIAICLAPALIHEVSHMAFGNTFSQTRIRSGARATTNLNHIWAWPISSRVWAVAIGPVCDFCFLVAGVAWLLHSHSAFALMLATTSFGRLLWQFNLSQVRDGRLLLNLSFDRPEGVFNRESIPVACSKAVDLAAFVISISGFGFAMVRSVGV